MYAIRLAAFFAFTLSAFAQEVQPAPSTFERWTFNGALLAAVVIIYRDSRADAAEMRKTIDELKDSIDQLADKIGQQ